MWPDWDEYSNRKQSKIDKMTQSALICCPERSKIVGSGIGEGNKTNKFNRVSPSEMCNPDIISVPGNVEVIPVDRKNKEMSGSIFSMLIIYILAGVISGMLLKTVFENRIDFMDSLSLISSFTYVKSFMTYMAFVGGLLGLLIGIASAIFIDSVPDPLFLYIPILFMPLLIMVVGPMIMHLAKGTVTLAVMAIQAIPCIGLVYTFFRSFY